MNTTRVDIIVTDRSLAPKAFLSSTAWEVIDGEFDTKLNEGCNEFKFKLAVPADGSHPWGEILNGYIINVRAQAVGGPLEQYWKGVITKAPGAGTTKRVLEYEARGGWFELEKQRTTYYYEGAEIPDAVEAIKADFDSPVTIISESDADIDVCDPYTVADIEAEFDSPAELFRQLALMQTDVQYGVDQNGAVYFKDISTENVADYWLGVDGVELDVQNDTEAIVNQIFVQSKDVVAGGQMTIQDNDVTSQVAYGRRTKVYQLRNTKNGNDAYQYAAGLKATLKDERVKVDANLPAFSNFMFPRGNVRVTDNKDGTEYSFPIQRVSYKLDGKTGLIGSMELGSSPTLKLPDVLQEVMRIAERQSSNQISLTKIEHTKREEFAQQVMVDAKKNGFLNTYISDMTEKSVDRTKSTMGSQSFYNGQIVGPFGYAKNLIWSNPIPTFEQPEAVRLHTYFSELGRIDFDNDSDFGMFFFEDTTDPIQWRLDEDGHGAEQFDDAGAVDLYYREGGTGSKGTPWQLPANHSARFRIKILAVNTGRPWIFNWGRQSATVRNWIEVDMSSSSNLRVVIKTQNGGGVTTVATMNDATASVSEEREIQILYGAVSTQYTIRIYDADGTTVLQTSAAFSPATVVIAGSRMVFQNFYNNTDTPKRVAQIIWFEPQQINIGNNEVLITRSTGLDYTGAALTYDGITHQTVDLSTIDPGTVLRLIIINKHPGRILGWAISWGQA